MHLQGGVTHAYTAMSSYIVGLAIECRVGLLPVRRRRAVLLLPLVCGSASLRFQAVYGGGKVWWRKISRLGGGGLWYVVGDVMLKLGCYVVAVSFRSVITDAFVIEVGKRTVKSGESMRSQVTSSRDHASASIENAAYERKGKMRRS
jgi:hypothetical protein